MSEVSRERSLGELLTELTREITTLVRQEIQLAKQEFELAKTEITTKARKMGGEVAMAAVGGALAYAGLLVLLAAVVLGLTALGIQAWVAAAVVGGATVIVGYVLVNRALANMRRTTLVPTKTIESLKEDATWTRRQGA